MFKVAKSNWQSSILVCAKCTKKIGGGFGPKGTTPLLKLLRSELGKGRKATVGVVAVKCLGLCPKNAVAVIATQRPHEWSIVPERTPLATIVDALID